MTPAAATEMARIIEEEEKCMMGIEEQQAVDAEMKDEFVGDNEKRDRRKREGEAIYIGIEGWEWAFLRRIEERLPKTSHGNESMTRDYSVSCNGKSEEDEIPPFLFAYMTVIYYYYVVCNP